VSRPKKAFERESVFLIRAEDGDPLF